jgi:hypothetical protein
MENKMSLKFVEAKTKDEFSISVINMEPVQVGITDRGYIYLRTRETATCLNCIGETYPQINDTCANVMVKLYPNGTCITFEVIV